MTDALQLKGWRTIDVKRCANTNIRTIEAEYIDQPQACIKCCVIGPHHKHGIKETTYIDSPAWGSAIKIVAKRQRYKCKDCGSTFIQPVGEIDDDRRMTSRCIDYIRSRCFKAPYSHIADDLACDPKTVSAVAEDFVEILDKGYKPMVPEWIGIDETKLDGSMRCIITDVGNRKPIDILETRDKTAVVNWLWQFRKCDHVKGLSIDMWPAYRDAARSVFPDLPVVIDKFHVVRMAGYGLDQARISIGKKQTKEVNKGWKKSKVLLQKRPANLSLKQEINLSFWLENEPEIAMAYQLKESFYSIYDKPKSEAISAFDQWVDSVPKEMKPHYAKLISLMKNWRPEILAYFDYPITNGYTEALNGVAKVINRMGRGYSYKIIRARILFSKLPDAVRPPMRCYGGRRPYSRVFDWPTCTSCRCEYTESELVIADIQYPESKRVHRLPLCPECIKRFG